MLIGQEKRLLFNRNINYLDSISLIMTKQVRDMKSVTSRDRALIADILLKLSETQPYSTNPLFEGVLFSIV